MNAGSMGLPASAGSIIMSKNINVLTLNIDEEDILVHYLADGRMMSAIRYFLDKAHENLGLGEYDPNGPLYGEVRELVFLPSPRLRRKVGSYLDTFFDRLSREYGITVLR